VTGALEQPATAFIGHPEVTGTASRLTVRQLGDAQAAVPGLVLLDVRGPGEYAQGSIAGSVHIPLAQLRDRLGELDQDRPVVTFCAGGYRSSIAASLLRASGFADVSDLIGGYQAWKAAA
jgi:hydroxyacylglutathione hydrolase